MHSEGRAAGMAGGGRLLSLDVYRGLVVGAMILVTDPGTYSARYWPLCHSEWQRPTPTDLIFPAFLLMIGTALVLSMGSRLERGVSRARLTVRVLRRGALDRVRVGGVTMHKWVYLHGFASWLKPVNASLVYAVVVVGLNVLLVYPLYRRRIFLRF